MKWTRVIFLLIASFSLTGCAHFIANRITSKFEPDMSNFGNLPEFIDYSKICSTERNCVNVQKLDKKHGVVTKLSFRFPFNERNKVWNFDLPLQEDKKDPHHLIFMFPGFGQPKELLFFHQSWLSLITGAEVIVVGSADEAEDFKFGLNYVEPIVAEINKKKAKKVDLIGFSMGAVAAQQVAQHVDNARLHLVAPMTNFRQSTLSVWQEISKTRLYYKLVTREDVDDAVNIIFADSEVAPDELDIVQQFNQTNIPAFVYTSTSDTITLERDWKANSSNSVTVNRYENLNHFEMLALAEGDLMRTFTSNLLGMELTEEHIEIMGTFCDVGDEACINRGTEGTE
jgi:alpha/beta superfamily hydrolase